MPAAESDDLIRLSLWSRNRADEPQAVVSHESALVLHDLTELLPDEVHLTVPPRFRKEPPRGCVLHKAVLRPGGGRGAGRVPGHNPAPARSSMSRPGTTSQEQLEKAVTEALGRGLVRRNKLVEAIRRAPRLDRLGRALGERR